MNILHVTAECYPVAKAGGLGDVAGALPKYQCQARHNAMLVMPMYKTAFLEKNKWEVHHKGRTNSGNYFFDYTIIKEKTNKLGFELFLVDINGLLDRPKIYGYDDDAQRFVAFQIAVCHWLTDWKVKPDVVHCHDFHTGLIPFMFKYCFNFRPLAKVPTVFTIHNAEYQGWMSWDKSMWIPEYDIWRAGLLEWKNVINPLASAVKNAWKVTTVSPSYMHELKHNSNGLELLFEYEKGKCIGILNGIDTEVWNPKTDKYLEAHYSSLTVNKGKKSNKEMLCKTFDLDIDKPLFIFIGRLVHEKAANILPDTIGSAIHQLNKEVNFLILGSGDPHVEWLLEQLKKIVPENYNCVIGYNEQLSHIMYAGADFLLMPSRVEPCGLNQMYAMRYGTMPMVRRTGGLNDTVTDIGDEGWGICFNNAEVQELVNACKRALHVYNDPKVMTALRKKMMKIDNSWENTVDKYIQLYKSVLLN